MSAPERIAAAVTDTLKPVGRYPDHRGKTGKGIVCNGYNRAVSGGVVSEDRRSSKVATGPGDTTRRELYFFNLYRCLEAVVYGAAILSPFLFESVVLARPGLGQLTISAYLVAALVFVAMTNFSCRHLGASITVMLLVDTLVAALILVAVADRASITLMLIVNVAIAVVLVPRRAFVFAALASAGIVVPYAYGHFVGPSLGQTWFETTGMVVVFFASAVLLRNLGGQMRASEELAARRGVDLANLEQVNDLIIQRMKTGVLLIGAANQIARINEAAWHLVGDPPVGQRDLAKAAPELSRRLYQWRTTGKLDQSAVALAEGLPEVIPRFTRLTPHDDTNVLIFLDDTSLLSSRAEALTLSSLGRLSASIAHEIRNPLAAIRYSAQLLAESPKLDSGDTRLVEIINSHCVRANDVIENILQLSRRERSRPERIDLNVWVRTFVEDYSQANDIGGDSLRAIAQNRTVEAIVDPQHLQQVVWNLVQNALRYGRVPDVPARVTVRSRIDADTGMAVLEVVDRGPGIPASVAAQIFEPFFTTHEYGTGLGLYLARQMTEATQGALEYLPVAGGGSCFRITLTSTGAFSSAAPAPGIAQ